MSVIEGNRIRLRAAQPDDEAVVVAMRSTPEVRARWMGDDHGADFRDALESESLHYLMIETVDGKVVGGIQWEAEDDPDYRHAGIDVYLDPSIHGRGLGTDAVRALCRHLFEVEGHHRLTIDPAADNAPAIRCYEKVGFRPVGLMRQYERGLDGTWHDGLLMDLLAAEFPS